MTHALPRITDDRRRDRLARRHLLLPALRADTPEQVADALVGLHATDPATVYLSACARLAAPAPEAVDRALYEDLSLVKLLSMRRTIFAVTTSLAPVVDSSTARTIAARERATLLKHLREGAEGWDGQRLADTERAVLAALERRGEATTAELSGEVPALRETILMSPGKPYEARQSVGSRLLRLLASDGRLRRCRPRGSWTSSLYPWTAVDPLPELPVREAKAELVRRWLLAYGPGTEADVKWWTGWSLTDTRRALGDTGAREVALDGVAGGTGFVAAEDTEGTGGTEDTGGGPGRGGPWAALLPGLDPTAMGWRERDWYLDPGLAKPLFDGSGNIGPTVWWNGRVVGGWAQRADGEVVWRLLADIGEQGAAAVAAEAERLGGWLGAVRVTPRLRTPLERELSA